jgi:6-methylsalicylate decarboxylase
MARLGFSASRRTFLAGASAAIGVAGVPAALWGKAVARRIDVHHHFDPNLGLAGTRTSGPPMPGGWNLDRDLEDMERGGVTTAMLSWFSSFAAPSLRQQAARDINESGARLVADHPGRFALLANLPLPDIEASLAELAYGLGTLRAVGVCLSTNDGSRWLGDKYYDPLFAELNRLKAVVFVHPLTAACCNNLVAGVPDSLIEFGADTTRCIASLIFNGMTSRYPDVKFVFSHGGGATMAVIERFLGGTHGEIVGGIDTKGVDFPAPPQPAAGALNEIRKMHFDTAQATDPVILGALRKVVPVSQILYGTDFQFQTAEVTTRQLRTSGIFNATELQAVDAGNALRLFPGLAG